MTIFGAYSVITKKLKINKHFKPCPEDDGDATEGRRSPVC